MGRIPLCHSNPNVAESIEGDNGLAMRRRLAKQFERIRKDDLTRHSIVMTSSALIAGLLNYLYQLQMGRMLPRSEYGILFTMISLAAMLGTVTQTFQNATSRFTSTFRVQGRLGKIRTVWMFLLVRAWMLGGALFLLLALLSPMISDFLNIADRRYLLVLCASLMLSFALPVNQGLLQGLQRFMPLAICQVLLPLVKVTLGVLLVTLGFGVNGGLLPLVIGGVIVFAVSCLFVGDVARESPEKCEVSGVWIYTGVTFLAILSFGVLMNVDVVMAKHYMSEGSAGDYSAMSVVGRMALYAPLGIGTAMFPKTAELFDAGADPRREMRKALFYALIAGGAVLVVYCFFHGFIIDFAFKGGYNFGMFDLLKYGTAMLLLSLSFLLMNYFLSVKQMGVAYVALAVALLLVGLLVVFHSSLGEFVNVMLACGTVSLLLMLPFYVRDRKRYQL